MPCSSALRSTIAVLLFASACSRTTLEEMEEDGDAIERDAAAAVDASPNDAGQQPVDAADCGDRDDDGVCDDDDNCPDQANADQLDADANGTGDACELTVNCETDAIPSMVQGGAATFQNVTLNGDTGPITVAKGASLELRLNFSFAMCQITELTKFARAVSAGLEGQGSGVCQSVVFDGIGVPCLAVNNSPLAMPITVRAPSTAGPHYIVAVGDDANIACNASLSRAQRIAAFCVR